MEVSLLQEWLSQIAQNLPILAISVLFIGTIFGIAYKVISTQNKMIVDYINQAEERQEQEKTNREEFRRDVYTQLEKTLNIYQDVQLALPAIKSFMDKYPKMESIINFLNQNKHSYYDFLESIISRAKYAFKTNFKNGSEEEKADVVIDKSFEHVMRTLSEEEDLLNKEYHMAFAEFCKCECVKLKNELIKIEDVSIKMSIIESFFSNLRNILYHFRISINKYLKMETSEVREELKKMFEGFYVNEDKSNEETKELNNSQDIFGF